MLLVQEDLSSVVTVAKKFLDTIVFSMLAMKLLQAHGFVTIQMAVDCVTYSVMCLRERGFPSPLCVSTYGEFSLYPS